MNFGLVLRNTGAASGPEMIEAEKMLEAKANEVKA